VDEIKRPTLLREQTLRARLRDKAPLFGLFCELPCPEVIEIAGIAGWDFVLIDCEHAPISDTSLPPLLRAAAAAGIPAMVRVASNEPSAIQHILDAGPVGIQIPQVSSVEAAHAAISASRFHPIGRRGLNPFVRAADYSDCPTPAFLAASNQQILSLQIESVDGVQGLPEILKLGNFDVLFVGPYDLSQSLGIPGDVTNPRVFEAGARIAAATADHDVVLGVFVNAEPEARRWLDAGVRYLCYSVDTVLLLKALKSTVSRLRELAPPVP
jgi:4-hydroxy-2-oxoheptanedioate aldolase